MKLSGLLFYSYICVIIIYPSPAVLSANNSLYRTPTTLPSIWLCFCCSQMAVVNNLFVFIVLSDSHNFKERRFKGQRRRPVPDCLREYLLAMESDSRREIEGQKQTKKFDAAFLWRSVSSLATENSVFSEGRIVWTHCVFLVFPCFCHMCWVVFFILFTWITNSTDTELGRSFAPK